MKAIAYTQHGLPITDPTALVDITLPVPTPGPRDPVSYTHLTLPTNREV